MAQVASDKGGHTKEAAKAERLNYEAYQRRYFTSGCAPSFFAGHDLQQSFVVALICAEVFSAVLLPPACTPAQRSVCSHELHSWLQCES